MTREDAKDKLEEAIYYEAGVFDEMHKIINTIFDDHEAELEALQSRSCEGCRDMKKDDYGIRYCWCPTSPLSSSNQALHPSFYCSEWKAKQ